MGALGDPLDTIATSFVDEVAPAGTPAARSKQIQELGLNLCRMCMGPVSR
jgi:hypothetical protein